MPSLCQERRVLSDAVVAAVTSLYRAEDAYTSAKSKKSADVDELGIALANARRSEREAREALHNHVKQHGC
jgi:hypothetical protein